MRCVVIDDDPTFCVMLEHVALRHGLLTTSYNSIAEVDPETLRQADVVIVDYDLGEGATGVSFSQRLVHERLEVPVLLISSGQEAFKEEAWPDNIRGFTSKALGPFGVLDGLLQVVENRRSTLDRGPTSARRVHRPIPTASA